MSKATRTKEMRVRRLAARQGYSVHKSRAHESLNNRGHFMLVEVNRNGIVLGEKYDATLAEIEAYLKD